MRVSRGVSWGFPAACNHLEYKAVALSHKDKCVWEDVCWFPGAKLEFVLSRAHLSGLSPPCKIIGKWVVLSARCDHIKSICFMNT